MHRMHLAHHACSVTEPALSDQGSWLTAAPFAEMGIVAALRIVRTTAYPSQFENVARQALADTSA